MIDLTPLLYILGFAASIFGLFVLIGLLTGLIPISYHGRYD